MERSSDPPRNDSTRSLVWLGSLALIALVVVAYAPSWHAGFIWDDDVNITDNRNVRGGFQGLLNLWRGDAFDYYPLTWTLFWLEWHLWGMEPAAYHLVNVFLHAVAAIVVWRLLARLHVQAAWLGAALFALSPVNVATVAWITEGKNTLSLTFGAASLLAFLQHTDGNRRAYFISLLLFAGALLAKVSTAPLVGVLCLLLWWKDDVHWRKYLVSLIPFVLLAAAAGVAATWFQAHHVMFGENTRPEGFVSRLAGAGTALWFYLYTELLPVDLAPMYPRWNLDPHQPVVWLPLVAAIGAYVLLWIKRRTWGRGPFAAAMSYALVLAPVLGFFELYYMKFSLVADHWQYLASVVVMASTAALLTRVPRRAFAPLAALLIVSCGVLTSRQADVYRDSQTLWRTAIERNRQAWPAWHNLALDIAATNPNGAMDDYREALRMRPNYAPSHNNLAELLRAAGRIEEAIPHYQAALDSRPDYIAAHNNLALALRMVGRVDEAIGHFERALALDPDYVDCRVNLTNTLVTVGRCDEAQKIAERGLTDHPDDAALHFALGLALEKRGRYGEAVTHYERARGLVTESESYPILVRIAWIRATAPQANFRDGPQAVSLAIRACDATHNEDAEALDALAAAYAECGHFRQAVDTAELAARLASPAQKVQIERRERLFGAMLPFREGIVEGSGVGGQGSGR